MKQLRFSEETVLSVAKVTLGNARKTAEALSIFGISPDVLDQFESDISQAEALPSELHQRIELRDLTNRKDDILAACHQWGRDLRTRLQLAFGFASNEAQSFPNGKFNRSLRSENRMLTVMPVLLALAEKYQQKLAEHGQTPEILAEGAQLQLDLQAADVVQELGKDDKRMATKARYQLFAQLYDTVNRINRVGRIVFENNPVESVLFQSKWPRAAIASAEVAIEATVVAEV